ncbi:hypothetical protein L204_101433 [Cryptococcus depauperatus]
MAVENKRPPSHISTNSSSSTSVQQQRADSRPGSPSYKSSVRFDQDEPVDRLSKTSFKFTKGLPSSGLSNSALHQPLHPSSLHTSLLPPSSSHVDITPTRATLTSQSPLPGRSLTSGSILVGHDSSTSPTYSQPPSPRSQPLSHKQHMRSDKGKTPNHPSGGSVKSSNAISNGSGTSSNSGLKPFPPLLAASPSLKSLTSESTFISTEKQADRPFLTTHPSQDRRVWSETLPPRRSSVVAHGRRVSRVTGGFETSSEDESSLDATRLNGDETNSLSVAKENSADSPKLSKTSRQRKVLSRSKSLVVPAESSKAFANSVNELKRRSNQRPQQKTSRERSRGRVKSESFKTGRSHSRTSHRFNITERTHGQNGAALYLPANSAQSHHDSMSGTSRRESAASFKLRSISRVRQGSESASSLDVSGKRKGKQRAAGIEREGRDSNDEMDGLLVNKDFLTESLGLGDSKASAQDTTLNTDQIHSLLSDSNVASALRLMSGSLMGPRKSLPNLTTSPFERRSSATGGLPHASPYLVTAPPALTEDSPTSERDRTFLAASSILPMKKTNLSMNRSHFEAPHQHGLRSRGQWASMNSIGMDNQGGYVPFVHHLPMVTGQKEDKDNDNQSVSSAIMENGPSVLDENLSAKEIKQDRKDKKNALSHFFHLGRRKGSDTNESAPNIKDHVRFKKEKMTRQNDFAKEEELREEEMRKIEWEKRQEEFIQERRYHALTQVAAHPNAERRAYQAGAHLRAYYQQVYDCIQNPPRLNFTKMLRWLNETDRQDLLRSHYYASLQTHTDESNKQDLLADKLSMSRSYQGSHSGHSRRLSSTHKSDASGRSTSIFSQHHSEASPLKTIDLPKRGWKYTVEEIQAFRESGGIVNYFVPPRQIRPDIDILPEDGKLEAPISFAHGGQCNNRDRITRPETLQSKLCEDREGHRDDNSSVADSSKKSRHYGQRISAASKTASNISLTDLEQAGGTNGSEPNLSQSASINTGKERSIGRHREPHLSHRGHHSLSAVGQGSLTQALKQPFEKFSSVARKQRNLPHLHLNNERGDITPEDSGKSSHPDNAALEHGTSHISRDSIASTNKAALSNLKGTSSRYKDLGPSFFKRYGFPSHEMTTDEEGGKRKLFIKGHRRPALEDLRNRFDKDMIGQSEAIEDEGLKEAEMAYTREQHSKQLQLQAEEENKERKTKADKALIKILKLEDDVYNRRTQLLSFSKERLISLRHHADIIDESIRHYLAAMDFARDEAKIGMDLEADWSLVEPLRSKYNRQKLVKDDDNLGENRDTLPPLKIFGNADSNFEGRFSGRRTPAQKNPRSSASVPIPKRKLTSPTPFAFQPLGSFQTRHRVRRTYLAPNGLSRVDPITQTELMIVFAKEQQLEMGKEKEEMANELEEMINQIEGMIKQKDEVRHWIREILERANNAQTQLERLRVHDSSPLDLVHFAHQRDWLVNSTTKALGLAFRFGWRTFQHLKLPFKTFYLIVYGIFCLLLLPWTIFKFLTRGKVQVNVENTVELAEGRQRRRRALSLMGFSWSVALIVVAIFFWYYGTDA